MPHSVYIGDSATLSYLQLIRMIVESSTGPSPFTMDPQRHRIIESIGTVAPTVRNTHLLPDRITAMSLIESFFINVCGISITTAVLAEADTLRPTASSKFSVGKASWVHSMLAMLILLT